MVHFRSHRSILGHLGTLLAILGIFGCLDHFGSHLTTLDQFSLQLFGPLWSILVSFGSPWSIFLATGPRGVAALVPVSDDKIQISLLILRRGALSTLFSFSIISNAFYQRRTLVILLNHYNLWTTNVEIHRNTVWTNAFHT